MLGRRYAPYLVVGNYHRTEKLKQYKESHALAIIAEEKLRAQRPDLASYAFGAGPIRRFAPR